MVNLSRVRAFLVLMLLAVAGVRPAGQAANNYVIGAQDVLLVTLINEPQLSGRYTVEADGEFTFPLIGRVKAAGLTARDLEAGLKKRLADGYFKNPQVTVSVAQYQSQRLFVTGEVRSPGQQLLTGGMTLVEALARAGSTLPTASGEVAIVREKVAEPILVNIRELEAGRTSQNIELRDGDQVYVKRAESIYIFGEVKTPGMYTAPPGINVTQALTLAGGPTPNWAQNRIKIQRTVDGKKVDISVKLTDLVLPGDTIIVPERWF